MTPTKAVLAAILAGLSTFVATVSGRTDVDTMSAVDWLIVIVSAIVAGLAVYTVPNRPKVG